MFAEQDMFLTDTSYSLSGRILVKPAARYSLSGLTACLKGTKFLSSLLQGNSKLVIGEDVN